jgi:hypothetical protein
MQTATICDGSPRTGDQDLVEMDPGAQLGDLPTTAVHFDT